MRITNLAVLILLVCLPLVSSKGGGGGGKGGGGGGSRGGSSGGSSGSSSSGGSSGGSSGSSSGSRSGGSSSSTNRGTYGVYYPYYPIGPSYGWNYYPVGGYRVYRTDACKTNNTVVIVNNEAYVCSEFLRCVSDNATIYTTANVPHTCYEVSVSQVYEAQLESANSGDLSGGSIALIVLGSLAGLFVIGLLAYMLQKKLRKRNKSKTKYMEHGIVPPPSVSGASDHYYDSNPVTYVEDDEAKPLYSSDASWNNASYSDYDRAKAYQSQFPPPNDPTPTADQQWMIQNQGIGAWAFVTDDPANVSTTLSAGSSNPAATGYSEIKVGVQFHPSQTGTDLSVMSELPLGLDPNGLAMKREFYYFEVTVEETSYSPHATIISVGLATRPYPPFRMIGHNKFSVGYHSDDGHCFVNDTYGGRNFGSPFSQGSVVGVGYVFGTGAVFFTLNGTLVGEATMLEERTLHPYCAAIASDGPARLSVNFGQAPFVYANANPTLI
ncbi:hypothetical protein BJ742DRAFT_766059 [Cladochytrium replicatum]|nr:hypothetical protein BJ742DRAFT_766059 [Cladochytrium replicatum]